jgi:hypothetical protein
MKDWTFILGIIASLFVCYLCSAHTDVMIRVVCFIAAAFWICFSWMLFARTKLGDDWFWSHNTGKAGFPGSVRACIGFGLAAVLIGGVFVFLGIRH